MRIIIIIFSLFNACAYACGGNAVSEFRPFAVEIKNYPNLNSYWVFFPENDHAENKMHLSGISASIENELIFDLEYFKSEKYPSFYSALVSVKDELINTIVISGSYNNLDSSGTSFSLCGNSKIYKLKKLIDNGAPNV